MLEDERVTDGATHFYDREPGDAAPGSATIPHVHTCREEFLVLDGEAIEDDGRVLKPRDWIVYEAGTRHHTRTVTGCLLLGLDWDPPD